MKPEPENWKVNIAKKKRYEGLPYSTRKKERSAKIPKDNVISPEEKNHFCHHYLSLRYTEQKNFILSNVEVDTSNEVLAIRGSKK